MIDKLGIGQHGEQSAFIEQSTHIELDDKDLDVCDALWNTFDVIYTNVTDLRAVYRAGMLAGMNRKHDR
jgi:hypothetical protein